jgi:hypothetical protein
MKRPATPTTTLTDRGLSAVKGGPLGRPPLLRPSSLTRMAVTVIAKVGTRGRIEGPVTLGT